MCLPCAPYMRHNHRCEGLNRGVAPGNRSLACHCGVTAPPPLRTTFIPEGLTREGGWHLRGPLRGSKKQG